MERKNSFSYQPVESLSSKCNSNNFGSSTFSKLHVRKSMTLNFPLTELPPKNLDKNPELCIPQSKKDKFNLSKSTIFPSQTTSHDMPNPQDLKKKANELIHQTEAFLDKLCGEGRIKRSEVTKFNGDSFPSYSSSFRGIGKKSKGGLFEKKQNSFSIEKNTHDFGVEKKSTFKSSIFENTQHQISPVYSAMRSKDDESTFSSETTPYDQHSNFLKINKIKNNSLWLMAEKRAIERETEQCLSKINQPQQKKRMSAPLPKIKKELTLESFNIIEKIGKGAYGDVFLAQEKETRTLYVIKTLSKIKIKQEKLQQHIFREIKLQMYMSHKHLTPLYGFFDDEKKIYLILEYMPDGNLSHLYRKKKVPEPKVSSIIRQVCEGLNYMHTENVLHRDIKPQNLFVHEDYVKIGDFGCAVFSHTMRNTMVGCLAYISPEQLLNSDYDEKIDVWSVGILAFQLLTGKPPFEKDIIKISQNKQEPKLSTLNFPKDVELSIEAINFVEKLLREEPTERMDLRSALRHPFLTKWRKNQFN